MKSFVENQDKITNIISTIQSTYSIRILKIGIFQYHLILDKNKT